MSAESEKYLRGPCANWFSDAISSAGLRWSARLRDTAFVSGFLEDAEKASVSIAATSCVFAFRIFASPLASVARFAYRPAWPWLVLCLSCACWVEHDLTNS